MALHTLLVLKKIAFAKQVVTGAFINGALLGLGAAALTAVAMQAAKQQRGPLCRQRDDDTPVSS